MALDISKAFDRVWHAGLLHKLKSYGISGQIFGLTSSFLSNKQHRVVLDGKSSQEYPVSDNINILMMLAEILLSMLTILLFILSVIRHLICGNNLNWLLNLYLIYKTLWTGVRSGLLISVLGKLSWFHFNGLITIVLLI